MEATQSSETSVGFRRTTRYCILEGRILQRIFCYILSIDYSLTLVMDSINHIPESKPSLPRPFNSLTNVITGCRLIRCCTILSDPSLIELQENVQL
jgi:hypothetical protein